MASRFRRRWRGEEAKERSHLYVPRGKIVREDTSRTMLLKDAVSSWCGDSLESSTFSMVLQQMMEPILTRGSFHRRPSDVPAENGWNRIEFLQGVIPAATQTDSLGLFRMLPSGRAQLTGIPPCTHGP